ncbi:MAG: hypothetical protein KAT43_05700, partial [Nanoarchaeota archaeon]|nr:hypothetical protein [Nanoarchaeota archaeon]
IKGLEKMVNEVLRTELRLKNRIEQLKRRSENIDRLPQGIDDLPGDRGYYNYKLMFKEAEEGETIELNVMIELNVNHYTTEKGAVGIIKAHEKEWLDVIVSGIEEKEDDEEKDPWIYGLLTNVPKDLLEETKLKPTKEIPPGVGLKDVMTKVLGTGHQFFLGKTEERPPTQVVKLKIKVPKNQVWVRTVSVVDKEAERSAGDFKEFYDKYNEEFDIPESVHKIAIPSPITFDMIAEEDGFAVEETGFLI